jgi:molybdenum cofactor cytidylyltransferase
MSKIPVPGIILAAGKSRRMGKNKLLLTFHGKPLLQHVLDAALASDLAPVLLVVSKESSGLPSRISKGKAIIIYNTSNLGYSSSLQAGLNALTKPCNGAMFLLGDQPLVTSQTINQLISAFQKEPERWVAPSYQGKRGNPVITPSAWFDKIHALDGDTGPREHLTDSAAGLLLVNVEDQGVIFDIDQPQDYDQLLKMQL